MNSSRIKTRIHDLRLQAEVGLERLLSPARQRSYLLTRSNALLRPTRIYGLLNDRCNERCLSCDHWRRSEFPELPAAVWLRALEELRELAGTYHINFSGGEPFLRKDIFEIFEGLSRRGILFGVCTNGGAITEAGARRLCELRMFNYNTSLDGANPATHNYLRGTDHAWDWVVRGIERIRKAGREVGYTPPIVIKPTVNRHNMREMPELVRMAKREGWGAVNFQPMGRWTEESKPGGALWVNEEDLVELEAIVEELCEMRRQGYPIWTTTDTLKMMVYHFKETTPARRRSWCSVGMTNLTILPNGDVSLCSDFPPVGNIERQSIRDIWFSAETEEQRQVLTRCTRLCLQNCLIERSLRDQLQIFNLLRRARGA